MQAIILAAGMGKRLKELTQNNTKCMVKVNGVSLIDRLLHQMCIRDRIIRRVIHIALIIMEYLTGQRKTVQD